MPDEREEILSVRLPATGFGCRNFADSEGVSPAGLGELAVPGVALFLQGSHSRSFAMPPQYGSNVCRRIAENPK